MSDDILLKDEFDVADQVTSAQTPSPNLEPVVTGREGEYPAPDFEISAGTQIPETLAPAHPHAERMTGIMDFSEIPGRWTYEGANEPSFAQQYSDAGHFPDTSALHPEFNPLWSGHHPELEIAPLFIRKVRSFYESGQSAIDAQKEMNWVLHHMTSGSGGQRNPILNATAMGALGSEHTSHALYENNYNDWLDTPIYADGGTERDEMQYYLDNGASQEVVDAVFRKKHLVEYEKKWQHDPEWKLGEKDYYHGMEWLNHAEREEAYKHMYTKGTDSISHQSIPSLDQKFSVPRAKYSRAQRESPVHKHFTREPMNTGEPIQSPILKDPSVTDSRRFIFERLSGKRGEGFYQGLMNHHTYHTAIERQRRSEYKTAKEPKYGYQLNINRDTREVSMKPISSKHFEPNKEGKLTPRGLGRKELMLMAGVEYDKERDEYKFYPEGQHPFYSSWNPKASNVTWTEGQIKDFFTVMDEERNAFKMQNDVANALQFHVNHAVATEGTGAHPEMYTGGDHSTLSSWWSLHGIGGHGSTYSKKRDMTHSAFEFPNGTTIHTQGPVPLNPEFIEAEEESFEEKIARKKREAKEAVKEGPRGTPTTVLPLEFQSSDNVEEQREAVNLSQRGEGGAVVAREGAEGLAAPFGEPQVNAMLSDGTYIVADPTNIKVGMLPHSVAPRRRFGGNAHAARNSNTWASSYHNKQFLIQHDMLATDATEQGQAAARKHKAKHLFGEHNSLVNLNNKFRRQNNTDTDRYAAKYHHLIPSIMGFVAPSANPQSGIHDARNMPENAHYTTATAADFQRILVSPTAQEKVLREEGGNLPIRAGMPVPKEVREVEERLEEAQNKFRRLHELYDQSAKSSKVSEEEKERMMASIKSEMLTQEALIDQLKDERDEVAEEKFPQDNYHRQQINLLEQELDHAHADYLDAKEELDELLEYKEERNDNSAHLQEKIDASAEKVSQHYGLIKELEEQLDQHFVSPKTEAARNKEFDNLKRVLANHSNVIAQYGATAIAQAAAEQGFDLVAEMGPDVAAAFKMRHGNTYLNTVPHSVHGAKALHPAEVEVVENTGEVGLDLARLGLNIRHLAPQLHGKPLSLKSPPEEWLEALGMQASEYDLEGNKTAGKTNIARDEAVAKLRAVHKELQGRFPDIDAFHVLPVTHLLQSVGGMKGLDLRGFGDLHSHIKDELSYYIDENGDKQPKFAPMNRTAPPHQVRLTNDAHDKPEQVSEDDRAYARHQRRYKINRALERLVNLTLGAQREHAAENGILLAEGDFLGRHRIKKPRGGSKAEVRRKRNDAAAERKLDLLDSFFIVPKGYEPKHKPTRKATKLDFVEKEIGGPAGSHENDGVMSLYDSPAYCMNYGTVHDVPFGCHIDEKTGAIRIYRRKESKKESLVTPLLEHVHALVPQHREYFGDHRNEVPLEAQPRALRRNKLGRSHNEEVSAPANKMDGPSLLASLTNPDYIRKDMPDGVPSLQAMHRIFELDDMEHLKGFTGDWVVSDFPEGPRFFVTKKDGDIESKADLSDEEKAAFKKVSDKDFVIDAIRGKDVIHIFDILEFDGNDTYDIPIQERIKILRGALESVEMVHTPSASDTKLTDDAGLASAVKNLEGPRILMRDAKSAYMKGEPRHPKWVMLQPGSEIVLMVLDRRGEGPYQYRLGTGPIAHGEDLGDRRVKHEGDDYMDVGASFQSKDKYDVGDLVRVDVTNVTETEASEKQKVYTVHAPKIEGEAEGEGLVSSESLSMLAKGELYHHPVEVFRKGRYVQIKIGDSAVVYKATVRDDEWSVHTPEADNPYVLRLSENQRPFWSPVVGVLLKGELEIEEKAEVKESTEPAEPLTKPHKVEGTEWKRKKRHILNKSLLLLERLLEKSSVGAVGDYHGGAKGLGFDYGTPIESPSGPTNLNDAKTMPDYDVRDIERDNKERAEDKKKLPKSDALQGDLELTDEKAVIHTD